MQDPLEAVKKICYEHLISALKNFNISNNTSDLSREEDRELMLTWKIQHLEDNVSALAASIATTDIAQEYVDSIVADFKSHTLSSLTHIGENSRGLTTKMERPDDKNLGSEIKDLEMSRPPSIKMDDPDPPDQPISSRLRPRTNRPAPTSPSSPRNERQTRYNLRSRTTRASGLLRPRIIIRREKRAIGEPQYETTKEEDEEVERVPNSDIGSVRFVIRERRKARDYGIKVAQVDYEVPGPPYLVFFADGSYSKGGTTFAGAGVTYRRSQDKCDTWVELAHGIVGAHNANDAEILAIGVALENALEEVLSFESEPVQQGQRRLPAIIILSDSRHCFSSISSLIDKNLPSVKPSNRFVSLILGRLRILGELGVQVIFHWVPGHDDVPGNCVADKLAASGSNGARLFSEDLEDNEEYKIFLVSKVTASPGLRHLPPTLSPGLRTLKRKRTQSPSPERRGRKRAHLQAHRGIRGRLGRSPRKQSDEHIKIEIKSRREPTFLRMRMRLSGWMWMTTTMTTTTITTIATTKKTATATTATTEMITTIAISFLWARKKLAKQTTVSR
ncbi:hypothetical protein F4779DRAFT_280119 [Xylariaceae sp. FL0662B]|nr:hypothetical protein F4779DRAFT_280119 [Xylariaceae sp. FL0662B]